MKILIVEDEVIAAKVIGRYLEDRGHVVKLAATVQQGLELGRRFEPDALLVDYMLDDESTGADLAKNLQESNPDLQVFVMTGMPIRRISSAIADLEHATLLTKPLELTAVAETLERCSA